MHENLFRVEAAVSATSSGHLTPGQWPHDMATALGFAGRRNPLGFAVVRYLSNEPSASSVWAIVLNLASVLVALGHDAIKANEAAWVALDEWNNARCRSCGGRGVMNIEQRTCPVCGGSGNRDMSALPDIVIDGIVSLKSAESWMEGQLNSKLRK